MAAITFATELYRYSMNGDGADFRAVIVFRIWFSPAAPKPASIAIDFSFASRYSELRKFHNCRNTRTPAYDNYRRRLIRRTAQSPTQRYFRAGLVRIAAQICADS
jgi:hypothetical protein